jgi:hypothetical protein
MLADTLFFLLPFTPDDALFVAHHLLTAGYMVSALALGRGGISCLLLMFLGELTSVLQNAWLVARELRQDSKAGALHLPPHFLQPAAALCHQP